MPTEIKRSRLFIKHLNNLKSRFSLSREEAAFVLDEIENATEHLKEQTTLPESLGYQFHRLTDAPWTGYMEFHVADNILVVYADLSSKQTIRLIGIYTHEMLRSGLLD